MHAYKAASWLLQTYTFAFLCHSVKDGGYMNPPPPIAASCLSYQSGTVWLLIPVAALTAFLIETQP